MKKILFGTLLLGALFISCSKDGDDQDTTPAENYLTTTAGSTWNYRSVDNINSTQTDYMLTSTSRDTSINTRSYHIYTLNTSGASSYNGKSGDEYFDYTALPSQLGGSYIENIYLKANAAVNATWTQTRPLTVSGFDINVLITNKIIEKGISRVVNGTRYNNVIHVKTDLAISGVPAGLLTLTTDIHQYYAPQVGRIESNSKIDINFMGAPQSSDVTLTLQSYTLL